ncbi:MAG: hypothetical protein U1E56_07125 [Bauldia sp.]
MDRRIVIVAGAAAIVALVALGVFLVMPLGSRQETAVAVAPQLATLAAGANPVAAAPPTAAPTPALALPDTGLRAVLSEEPLRQGAPEQKVRATVAWTLVDGGLEGVVVEARARVPERQLDITMRLKRNTDALLPATHIAEIVVVGPPGQPPPVKTLMRLALKRGEDIDPPQELIGARQKIVDGLFWVALSKDPKFAPKNLETLSLPWFDLLLEYSTGRRAVLSFEKGQPGTRVLDQALAAWSSVATR